MQRRRRTRRQVGLTLVETALLVSIIGVLLAIAVPTFVRTVQTSKVAEASSALDTLYRASAAYYATERPAAPAVAAAGMKSESATAAAAVRTQPTAAGPSTFCLPESAGPAPEKPSAKPVPFDFQADSTPGVATWRALAFSLKEPIRYRYTYLPAAAGCRIPSTAPAPSLTLRAEGDLDGDGVYSQFERTARIVAPGVLVPDLVLHVRDRVE